MATKSATVQRQLPPPTLKPKAAAAIVRDRIDLQDARLWLRSTPARLLGAGAVAIVICLLAGLLAANATSNRQRALHTLRNETAPSTAAAQQLYVSLSLADAAAASGFIAGGLEPQTFIDQYRTAIATAAAQVASSAARQQDADAGSEAPAKPQGASATPADSADTRALLAIVAAGLPQYTALVDTARTYNRAGYPVGEAYLAEASWMLHTQLLPTANRLHKYQTAALADTQHDYSRPPWGTFAMIVAAIVVLGLVSLLITRHSRRMINLGVVVAAGLMTVLLVWLVIASSISAADTHDSLRSGTEPLQSLTNARIIAQRARSAETLKMVRHDTSGHFDTAYTSDVNKVLDLLKEAGDTNNRQAELTAIANWQRAHQQTNTVLDNGDLTGASNIVIGTAPDSSASQFSALDAAISADIQSARNELRHELRDASSTLTMLSNAAIVLSVLAGLAVLAGLWPRVREYR